MLKTNRVWKKCNSALLMLRHHDTSKAMIRHRVARLTELCMTWLHSLDSAELMIPPKRVCFLDEKCVQNKRCFRFRRNTSNRCFLSVLTVKKRDHASCPSSLCHILTGVFFPLDASNVCLFGENPTCSVPALQGCEALWSYDYGHA